MSKIKIHDLKPTGADLFDDSESFLSELSNDELHQAVGGLIFTPPTITTTFPPPTTFPTRPTFPPTTTFPTRPWTPVIL